MLNYPLVLHNLVVTEHGKYKETVTNTNLNHVKNLKGHSYSTLRYEIKPRNQATSLQPKHESTFQQIGLMHSSPGQSWQSHLLGSPLAAKAACCEGLLSDLLAKNVPAGLSTCQQLHRQVSG